MNPRDNDRIVDEGRVRQIHFTLATISDDQSLTGTGSIEMNVIIVAACIPTLRPLVLVLLGRPSGSQYRNGASSRRSYSQHLGPNRFSARHNPPSHTSGIHANKAFDSTTELHSIASDKNKPNPITVNREVQVQSGETTGDDGNNLKRDRQWGYERTLENGRAQ